MDDGRFHSSRRSERTPLKRRLTVRQSICLCFFHSKSQSNPLSERVKPIIIRIIGNMSVVYNWRAFCNSSYNKLFHLSYIAQGHFFPIRVFFYRNTFQIEERLTFPIRRRHTYMTQSWKHLSVLIPDRPAPLSMSQRQHPWKRSHSSIFRRNRSLAKERKKDSFHRFVMGISPALLSLVQTLYILSREQKNRGTFCCTSIAFDSGCIRCMPLVHYFFALMKYFSIGPSKMPLRDHHALGPGIAFCLFMTPLSPEHL